MEPDGRELAPRESARPARGEGRGARDLEEPGGDEERRGGGAEEEGRERTSPRPGLAAGSGGRGEEDAGDAESGLPGEGEERRGGGDSQDRQEKSSAPGLAGRLDGEEEPRDPGDRRRRVQEGRRGEDVPRQGKGEGTDEGCPGGADEAPEEEEGACCAEADVQEDVEAEEARPLREGVGEEEVRVPAVGLPEADRGGRGGWAEERVEGPRGALRRPEVAVEGDVPPGEDVEVRQGQDEDEAAGEERGPAPFRGGWRGDCSRGGSDEYCCGRRTPCD